MPLSFREADQLQKLWGRMVSCARPSTPATGTCSPVYKGSGGLPTRRRLPTCPTTSAEFPFVGKLSGVGTRTCRVESSLLDTSSPCKRHFRLPRLRFTGDFGHVDLYRVRSYAARAQRHVDCG